MRALRWIVGVSLALVLGTGTFVAVRNAGAEVVPGPLAGLWQGKGTLKLLPLDKGAPGFHAGFTADLVLTHDGSVIGGTMTVTLLDGVEEMEFEGTAGTGRLWLVRTSPGGVFVLKGTVKGKAPKLVLSLDGDDFEKEGVTQIRGTLKKVVE